MARKLSIVMLSLSMMLLLLVQNNATITEAPTPQPQQSTNGFPMHGVTQGSLHPQVMTGTIWNDATAKTVVYLMQSVRPVARLDAPKQLTRNPACSSARNAVPSACACLQEHMGTSNSAPATITGRPREEDPSAPRMSWLHLCRLV
ncbi:hypothetical protein CK203_078247 [Vitis vinifera]|uniref:Uncharacterized protein n=1 Tax=Vitis vinifera TaxID=29760 RepID=A0A438DKK6_VITVI|nr:hypothetical protein CK203_078247 [Vitis vinifera]